VAEVETDSAEPTPVEEVEEDKVYVAKTWGAPSDPYVSYSGEEPKIPEARVVEK
jgi:hypothetical protein